MVMDSLKALLPVVVMIGLGNLARRFQWITQEQKEGATTLVFGILFPIMVFNLLSSTKLEMDIAAGVVMLLVCYTAFYFAGKSLFSRWLAPYGNIGGFLLTTAEGGNMALPLFLSIVGSSSPDAGDPMLLDLAGILFCFVVIPFLVCLQKNTKFDGNALMKQVLRSPMIIAACLGLVFNLSGLYSVMAKSTWMPVYTSVMNMVTAAITPIVLFSVGYDLQLKKGIVKPALRFVVLRLALFAGIIGLFFVFFPARMANPAFLIAVLLYFMAPTGFGVLGQIAPLVQTEDQKEYCSAVLTLNMVVTLVVYVCCVFLYPALTA